MRTYYCPHISNVGNEVLNAGQLNFIIKWDKLKITVTGGLYEVFKIFIGFIFTVANYSNRRGNFLQ